MAYMQNSIENNIVVSLNIFYSKETNWMGSKNQYPSTPYNKYQNPSYIQLLKTTINLTLLQIPMQVMQHSVAINCNQFNYLCNETLIFYDTVSLDIYSTFHNDIISNSANWRQ